MAPKPTLFIQASTVDFHAPELVKSCYLEIDVDALSYVKPIALRVFPNSTGQITLKKEVRRIGTGWLDVTGPHRHSKDKHFTARWCPREGVVLVIVSGDRGAAAASYSRFHIQLPEGG